MFNKWIILLGAALLPFLIFATILEEANLLNTSKWPFSTTYYQEYRF